MQRQLMDGPLMRSARGLMRCQAEAKEKIASLAAARRELELTSNCLKRSNPLAIALRSTRIENRFGVFRTGILCSMGIQRTQPRAQGATQKRAGSRPPPREETLGRAKKGSQGSRRGSILGPKSVSLHSCCHTVAIPTSRRPELLLSSHR